MRYLQSFLLRFVAVVYIGTSAYAGTISQSDFLDQLEETHPMFEKERLTAQIEQQERASYLGDQDWAVHSSLFLSHEEPSFAFAGPEKTDALSLAGGVQRRFWSTGGVLSASFSSGYASLKIDPFLGLPNSYFENRLAVTYGHPLRRNKHGVLDQLYH